MAKIPNLNASTPELPDIAKLIEDAEAARMAGRLGQAEMLSQRVLAAWPSQPQALHLLGLIAHAHGNLELALDFLRRATLAPSASANFYSNLAEMCRQCGLLEEGERAGRRAVDLNPRLSGGWNNLGIILQEAGKLDESRSCLERVLELQPNNADAYNNLANTCKRLGLLEKAEHHWNRALELRPNYAEAMSNMVMLLTEQGKYPQAEEYGLRALRLNPRLTDAYLNLSALATVCHNHEAALDLLNQLLRLAPRHAGGMAATALALRQLDRIEEALAIAKRAVATEPTNPEPHNALGAVLQAAGRVEEARAAYERAATVPGAIAEKPMVSIGRLLMENGRTDEAQAEFLRVIDAFPQSAAGWYNYAEVKKFERDDPAISRMEELLASGELQSHAQQTLMHFGLGKVYLDIGDSDAAFAHLNEGNRMKRATINYDSVANTKWIDGIGETFSAELMEQLSGGGATSDVPVFVLGMPRSGTTLVEQILASHSAIHGAGELKYLHRVAKSAGEYPTAIGVLPQSRMADLGNTYLGHIAPVLGGRRHVVDKMPSNFLYAGLIRLTLPNARIIHCRRDPIDTCLSCYTKIFADEQSFTYDMTELGAFHRAYQRLMAHWRTVLPTSHFIEVDYEAMVEDTDGQSRRLLEFLGLPWEDRVLEFYRTERPVRTASVNQVRKPVYQTSSGRWKKNEKHLGPLLTSLGITNE